MSSREFVAQNYMEASCLYLTPWQMTTIHMKECVSIHTCESVS